MKQQVAPHGAFPSGGSWIAGVLRADPGELSAKFGLQFERGVGDLGGYRLAALEDPAAGQFWLFRYDSAPYPGTEVHVDEGVPRDEALFAVWRQLGIDIRGFDWVNPYAEYPRGNPADSQPEARPVGAFMERMAALTPREREVLELLTEGSSNAEIGQRLRVSLPTVTSHLRHIAAKLGARNVRQLRQTVSGELRIA